MRQKPLGEALCESEGVRSLKGEKGQVFDQVNAGHRTMPPKCSTLHPPATAVELLGDLAKSSAGPTYPRSCLCFEVRCTATSCSIILPHEVEDACTNSSGLGICL